MPLLRLDLHCSSLDLCRSSLDLHSCNQDIYYWLYFNVQSQKQMSICPSTSIHLSEKKSLKPIPLSESLSESSLSGNSWPHQPISHNANQSSCHSATMPPPLLASQNHNYWPSDLCPAFTTFKPFWLAFGSLVFEPPTSQHIGGVN